MKAGKPDGTIKGLLLISQILKIPEVRTLQHTTVFSLEINVFFFHSVYLMIVKITGFHFTSPFSPPIISPYLYSSFYPLLPGYM